MSSDINLITKNRSQYLREKRLFQLRLVSYIFLVGTAALSIALFILNLTSPLAKMKNQEADLLKQIAPYHSREAKLSLVRERVSDINKAKSQTLYFFPLVNILNKDIPSGVTLSSIDVSDSSLVITLSAQSLDTLNKYLDDTSNKLIKDKKVQTIILDSLVANSKGTEFIANIKVSLL